MNPEICMSLKKEPHFYSRSDVYRRGYGWYDSLWEHAGNCVRYYGESSTSYCVDELALTRIKKEVKNPKLILILRDPVERLLSHYRWMYAQGLEKDDLLRALDNENKEDYSADIHLSGCYNTYQRCSRYSYWVPLIQRMFGDENVLVLTTEALSENPQAVLMNCCAFLEVSPCAFEREVCSNQTSGKTVHRLHGLSKFYASLPLLFRRWMRPMTVLVKAKAGRRKLKVPEPSAADISAVVELLVEDTNFYSKLV
jgi:hypothetical protein